MSTIRCRIAPSPSGFLHLGTAKMALFNWLFARKTGGTFVLRLEDTDADRTEEEFVHAMCEGFQWLGIDWDEGPAFGDVPEKGDHGPYRQSQRKELHLEAARQLLDAGKAYKCFLSKEELDAEREAARAQNRPFVSKWRNASAGDVAAMGDAPHVVRFRVPEGATIIEDLVQGNVRTENREIEDFVIVKPNGDPIFHLAVVVDDALMGITHIIRGDDHLTNAFRHKMLFEALGHPLPKFAHLPMVLDEAGKKYSKRMRGANVLDWRDDGYLPHALINYVALLGWTPEEENREFFTIAELQEHFTPDRWGKSAARFDLKKLSWLNGQHIRNLPVAELRGLIEPVLRKAGFDVDAKPDAWCTELATICQEKLSTLNDIVKQADFFFQEITEYEEKPVKKHWMTEDSAPRMEQLIAAMERVDDWTHDGIKAAYEQLSEATGDGLGKLVHPTRLALTGKSVGPGLFELAALLGKDEALKRMRAGLDYVRAQ